MDFREERYENISNIDPHKTEIKKYSYESILDSVLLFLIL